MNVRADSSIFLHHDLSFATVASGVSLPYVECGAGEPLLFVHGSLCDYRYWDAQMQPLSAHFRCIAPSLSHYWPGVDAGILSDFGWRTHVDELADFIVAMDLAPVHLLGHSRGGCIAFHLAREYPRLVKSLILADPGGPLDKVTLGASAGTATLPASTNALRAKVVALIEAGDTDAGLELFVDSVSVPGAWKKSTTSFRTMAIDNVSTLPKQLRDPLPAYSKDVAADVKCRTLLIDGQKSPRMFRNNVESLAEWVWLAERETVAGASHGMNVASPRAFNAMVQGFLQR